MYIYPLISNLAKLGDSALRGCFVTLLRYGIRVSFQPFSDSFIVYIYSLKSLSK
jgi:hypothetical protein